MQQQMAQCLIDRNTMQSRYIAVIFAQIPTSPVARPRGRGMGFISWVQSLGSDSLSVKPSYNLAKSRSREFGCYNDCIALKFDKHLDSAAAEVPVKF